MAYEIIIDEINKTIEIHSDLCDVLLEKKDNVEFNNNIMYLTFNLFKEIEVFINNNKDFEIHLCDICKPKENSFELDEESDDFYEEVDEDEELDDSRCDIF